MRKIILFFLLFCALIVSAQTTLSRFNVVVSGNNTLTFSDSSTGSPTTFAWEFVGGNPTTSTSPNPVVTYATPGSYTAKLTVSNSFGSSFSTRTVKITTGNIIDLSTGRNDDGTLMPEIGAVDTDWTYTSPTGAISTPITRHANVSGWSSASTGGVAGITRWITGNNMIYGDHYYASKEFEIPEGVTTAVLNLRTLSFVRSWTYLVKKNTNGTESETLITNTVWQNDGARGWLNSRNPEVINYPLAAGKYFIKVKVFTNNSGQRQATDTNANVNFGNAIIISPIVEFAATPTSAFVGNNVQFTNMSQGTPSSLLWKFEDGANILTSTNNNPAVAFSAVGNHYAELNADYGNSLISSLRINNYIQTVQSDTPLVAVTQPSCGISSGAITVTSPTSGVTYSFDNGVTFQSSNTLSGLSSGTYVVKVKNENGIVSAATNVVINPAPTVPETPIFNITQPTCDINTGSVTVTSPASGVEYSFDGGVTYQTSSTKTGLSAGNYTIVIKNTDGCMTSAAVVINSINCLDWTKAPNSYIFTGKDKNGNNVDGLYIPVNKAYAMWKNGKYMGDVNSLLTGTQTPSVYWEDVSGLIKSISIEPGATTEQSRIKIEIDKAKGKGNAVVALHIGNGTTNDNVYWSWHVWVTDMPGLSGEATTGMDYKYDNITPFVPKFMDRNLGATSNTFLGNEWTKSNGLYYQWGRKDPFPSLTNKDGSYYEISTLKLGNVNNAAYPGNKIQKINRTSNDIKDNLRYAVGNPLTLVERINLQSGSLDSWFSNSIYEVNNTKYYDLWGDNYEGYLEDKIPGDTGFKGYQLKSAYDPCPCNYRVPSFKGSAAKSKFSVWGRDSDNNDDATDLILNPNGNTTTNNLFPGIKIYPGLGVDFTSVPGRNLGKMSLAGKIYANGANRTYPSNNFADVASEVDSWSASLGFLGARFLGVVNDYARLDVNPTFGLYQIIHSSGTSSGINTYGKTVRCIEDPNKELIADFATDFFSTGQLNYTTGIDNPNAYMIADNQTSHSIPMNKAFAIYNQYLSNHGWPVGSFNTSVIWTSNKTLIKKVSLTGQNENGNITVEFGAGNPKGNAVVALKDGQGKVIWSWHIWAPETAPVALAPYTTESVLPNASNLVNPTKSGLPPLTTEFMDRNLGALQAFPDLSASPTAVEAQQIQKSGGMLYQWGRKDPIPAFFNPVNFGNSISGSGDDRYSVYLETGKDVNGNSLYASSVDYFAHKTSTYSIPYTTYSNASNANVLLTEPRHEQIRKVLTYSVENPFKLLYNSSFTPVSGTRENQIDWISNQSGLFADRWGHGTKKSPFDPCPEGWRVPDVSFPYLMGNTNELIQDGQYGSSPWYFGDILRGNKPQSGTSAPLYPRYGLNQSVGYPIGGTNTLKYDGIEILRNSENKRYGWVFKNAQYNIGNFPATGYRALYNNPNMDQIGFSTAVWTASLGDQLYGRAFALEINTSTLKSGIGIIPQGAIPCRCAKIKYDANGKEIGRYDPDAIPVTPGSSMKASNVFSKAEILEKEKENKIVLFPNPVKDVLYIKTTENKDYYYQIYNASGQLVKAGKFENTQTSVSSLVQGVYLVRINNSEALVKIIKN
ncbi:PKD domain-containing protein [Chryseobacterium sp. CFBP8996]|nr:PKD domain-containing protein [Chryseobacterium sp. CFBP8996]MDY0930119.1 PKD domain-containing protein [Chryseobacterium sp. CFBP8996]